MDGSEDVCIDEKLKPFWESEGMASWREEYVRGIETRKLKKASNVMELIESLENPHVGGADLEDVDKW